jgi:hypothetical protein
MKHDYWRNFSFLFVLLLSTLTTWGQIQITYPTSRAVFQRNNQNEGTLHVAGNYTDCLDRVEVRLIPLDNQGTPTAAGGSWSTLQSSPQGGFFQGSLTAAGGWYQLQVRGMQGATEVGTASVDRVGVGEVFLIAGQSNATGDAALPAGPGATDDRVSSIDFQKPFNSATSYENPAFPCPVFTHLESGTKTAPFGNNAWSWGKFGDILATRLNVPVLILNAGWSGSGIGSWSVSTDPTATATGFGGFVYPVGMPYGHLRLALHYYVAQQGIRAILWHQGESDNDAETSQSEYETALKQVITKSREHSAKSALTWVVARASRYREEGVSTVSADVINAQNAVIASVANVFAGPETDPLEGPGVRDDINVHFLGDGHRVHAQAWSDALSNAFFMSTSTPYLPVPPPSLAVVCASPTQLMLSTTAAGTLNWINSTDCASSFATTASVTAGAGTYRLRQRDPATGNITLSASLTVPGSVGASATAGSNSPVVEGQALNLTAAGDGCGPTGFAWTGPTAFSSSQQNPSRPGMTLADAGTYRVTVRNLYGCTVESSVNVTVTQATPVELANFWAEISPERRVQLRWKTVREVNSSHFFLERSGDLRDFTTLARVAAQGTSHQSVEYAFFDDAPLSGTGYYRLRQVDRDGKTQTFRPLAVSLGGAPEIAVYPNPVGLAQRWQLRATDLQDVRLTSATGQVLPIAVQPDGTGRWSLQPEQVLQPGVYLLRVTNDMVLQTHKVIVR